MGLRPWIAGISTWTGLEIPGSNTDYRELISWNKESDLDRLIGL